MYRFVKLLSKFRGSYNFDVWTQNKSSSFISLKIRQFIDNIPLVTALLMDYFNSNEYADSIITCLNLWVDLCKCIHITTTDDDDDDDYKNEMDRFESNLKLFFTVGGKSYLTKGAVAGDYETFYMHFLRCYIPKIARTTFKDHHLGVEVFTI